MGRIAYIPLEFSKIERATEGEILIDHDKNDLYTIDDYKVPVSITKFLHEETSTLSNDINELEENSRRLRFEIEKAINDAIQIGIDLDEMILNCNLHMFYRLDELRSKYNGAKNLYDEINKTYLKVKTQLDNLLRDYDQSVNDLLDRVQSRYNNAKNIYDVNYQKYLIYKNLIDVYEKEIIQIKEDLRNKYLKLGEGSGEFTGTISSRKEVLLTLVLRVPYYYSNSFGPFYSNGITIVDDNGEGPGDFSIGYSYLRGDVPYNPNNLHDIGMPFSDRRHSLEIGDGVWNPVLLPDSKFITEEECKTFFKPTDLVRWYWFNGTSSVSLGSNFIDRHGQKATFYTDVDMVYRKKKSISYTNKLSFKV